MYEIKKDNKSRPLSVDGIKITLWNEPEHEFTIGQLMMEMGFFVLLHLNSDHLTRRTLISQSASAVIASSGDLVDVGSTVLCKPDHRDDEVSYSNAEIMNAFHKPSASTLHSWALQQEFITSANLLSL